MGHDLIRVGDDAALAALAAERWLDMVEAAAQAGRPHRVALAGGRITKRFLERVAQRSIERAIRLDGVDFFWGDERCVPPGDPESNFRLAQESLLARVGVPVERIHRVLGELDPATAAAMAEQDLRRTTGVDGEAMPVLDLVFLGMGEDAHVASLFPGALPEVTESSAVYVPATGPKPPPRRVSLTFRALAAAAEVWVLASGSGKEPALKASLAADSGTPLARVLRERARTFVFTDIPA
jgi:6-phosphogluconolactonase